MLKLAVFNSYFLNEYIENIMQSFNLNCEIKTFLYYLPEDSIEIFEKIHDEFDGFLINGSITTNILMKKFPQINKPMINFDVDYVSYFKLLLQLVRENRNLDFSRVYVDFMEGLVDTNLEIALNDDTLESLMLQYLGQIQNMGVVELISTLGNLRENIINLWKQGKIDCVVTRFSTAMSTLQGHHVPCHFAYPSRDHVFECMQTLINRANLEAMRRILPAIISVTLIGTAKENSLQNDEIEYVSLQKAILEYSKQENADFIIQHKPNGFAIITNRETVNHMTRDFSICTLKPFLQERVAKEVRIGYGVAKNIVEAKLNAANASRESTLCGGYSYAINENEELIGPLGEERSLVISSLASPYISELAQKTKLSPLTLQKILSVMQKIGSDQITAQILSAKLNITVRAGAQFLNKLIEANMAEVVHLKQSKTRGRPEKIYKVLIKNDNIN